MTLTALALLIATPVALATEDNRMYISETGVPELDGSSCTTGEAKAGETAECTFTCEPASEIAVSGSTPDGDPWLTATAECGNDEVTSCSGRGSCSGSGDHDDLTGATGTCEVKVPYDEKGSAKATCSSKGEGSVYVKVAIRSPVSPLNNSAADPS